MSSVEIDYIGEGRSDDAVARRIIAAVNGIPGVSYRRPLSGTGKQNLDRRLRGLNAGVRYGRPVLVIRDLDHDAPCPSALITRLLPDRHPRLLLRICVREAETWMMADYRAYSDYCGLAAGQIPVAPERLVDPKATILGWAESGMAPKLKRHVDESRRRGVPDWALLGEWHAEFAQKAWNPPRAAASGRSPSLTRTLTRLKALVEDAGPSG